MPVLKISSKVEACGEVSKEGGDVLFQYKGVWRDPQLLFLNLTEPRYYEWLTKGKDKLPHFIKRKDGKLMLMAGLYDCATIEGTFVFVLQKCPLNAL